MKLTASLRKAIQLAINSCGNISRFSQMIGVEHTTVGLWMSGKTTSISGKVWQSKLLPVLSPFLTPEL